MIVWHNYLKWIYLKTFNIPFLQYISIQEYYTCLSRLYLDKQWGKSICFILFSFISVDVLIYFIHQLLYLVDYHNKHIMYMPSLYTKLMNIPIRILFSYCLKYEATCVHVIVFNVYLYGERWQHECFLEQSDFTFVIAVYYDVSSVHTLHWDFLFCHSLLN